MRGPELVQKQTIFFRGRDQMNPIASQAPPLPPAGFSEPVLLLTFFSTFTGFAQVMRDIT